MRRSLRGEKRDRLDALHAAQIIAGEPRPLALADPEPGRADPAAQKFEAAVSAVVRAEEREQRRVLRDRQQLAFAERPSPRGEEKMEKG